RVHAQLQIGRQAVMPDSMRNYCKVVLKFLFELRNGPHVIDTLVESAGELRGDGLDRNPLVRDRSQNHQELRRSLRLIGFVHRDFRDEAALAFPLCDLTIDAPGLLHCGEILARNPGDRLTGGRKRLSDAGNGEGSDQLLVPIEKSIYVGGSRRLPDSRRYIESVEIAG